MGSFCLQKCSALTLKAFPVETIDITENSLDPNRTLLRFGLFYPY